METISHREMRNHSSEVLRAVGAGESYTITNHGVAVAQLIPMRHAAPDLPLARPATARGGLSSLRRHRIEGTSAETLDVLRSER